MKAQGLLKPCHSPCNTPNRGVQTPNRDWQLVQYLRLVNEAIISLSQVVPNPHTRLAQTLEDTEWLTVLDLKDGFFCVFLNPAYQFLFAFEGPGDQVTQLAWTVLPQGSPDSLQQALSRDLGPFEHVQVNIIQCVDEILLRALQRTQHRKGQGPY